jgi:iron-sulfur cluster repair protein YtfE (RIC family)
MKSDGGSVLSRNFTDLSRLHRSLEEILVQHQCALLHAEFEEALTRLTEYEAGLLAHMRDEENLMLPIYSERAEPRRGGGLELFLGEHRKMRQIIGKFRERVVDVSRSTDRDRSLIELLEFQTTFKHLAEHHNQREELILFPALDRVTSSREREEILEISMSSLIGSKDQ